MAARQTGVGIQGFQTVGNPPIILWGAEKANTHQQQAGCLFQKLIFSELQTVAIWGRLYLKEAWCQWALKPDGYRHTASGMLCLHMLRCAETAYTVLLYFWHFIKFLPSRIRRRKRSKKLKCVSMQKSQIQLVWRF